MGRWPIKNYRAYYRHELTSNQSGTLCEVRWNLKLNTYGTGENKGRFAKLSLERTPKEKMRFCYRFGWEDKNGVEVWKKVKRVKSTDDESQVLRDETFFNLKKVDSITRKNGSVTLLVALSFGSHKFRLRDRLSKDLGLLLDGKHTDVEIRVIRDPGGVIKAHRAILAVRSPMFGGMFDSDTIEKQTGVVTIDAFEFAVVRKLLEYLYTCHIELTNVAFAAALRIAADYYQVPDLVGICEKYVAEKVNKTSVTAALLSTAQLDSSSIKAACLAVIRKVEDVEKIDHIEELFVNPQLTKFVINQLLKPPILITI